MCPAQLHFGDAILSIASTTSVRWRIQWFVFFSLSWIPSMLRSICSKAHTHTIKKCKARNGMGQIRTDRKPKLIIIRTWSSPEPNLHSNLNYNFRFNLNFTWAWIFDLGISTNLTWNWNFSTESTQKRYPDAGLSRFLIICAFLVSIFWFESGKNLETVIIMNNLP